MIAELIERQQMPSNLLITDISYKAINIFAPSTPPAVRRADNLK